jgi:hypothetical protein
MTKKMTQKQMMIGGAIVLALVAGGGALAYAKMSGKNTQTAEQKPTKKKIADPVNVLAADQRPYLQIVPVADGRNLELIVKSIKKPAAEAEYELEYQAGSLLQGAFGAIQLSSMPAQAKILLGSCSAGGACTYHTDIKGGTLLTRFRGDESYALKSDWRYFDNQAKDSQISSKDAKFQLASPELKTQRYMIVFNTAGYPEGLTGTPVSDPYSLAVSSTLKGSGDLSIRANEEGTLSIMGWDGKAWKAFETKVDGKTATAKVDLMELYIVVKK